MFILMFSLKFTGRPRKKGFDLKSNFHIIFKAYQDKIAMRQQQLAKQLSNYSNQAVERNEFEQKTN